MAAVWPPVDVEWCHQMRTAAILEDVLAGSLSCNQEDDDGADQAFGARPHSLATPTSPTQP